MPDSAPKDVDSSEDESDWKLDDRLAENEATSNFDGKDDKFWPQLVLDELITKDSVLREFEWKADSMEPEDERLIDFIVGRAKKLTALTVHVDFGEKLLDAMKFYMSNGIDDKRLGEDADLGPKLRELNKGLWRPAKVRKFRENRPKVLVPIITTSETNHRFERGTILPFTLQMINPEVKARSGAFSYVQKVTIHDGHFEDPACPVCH